MYVVNADVTEAMAELDKMCPGATRYWPEEISPVPDPNLRRNYSPVYKALIPAFTVIAAGILVFGVAMWMCYPG